MKYERRSGELVGNVVVIYAAKCLRKCLLK